MSGGASSSHTSRSPSEAECTAILGLLSLGQGSHSRALIPASQAQQGQLMETEPIPKWKENSFELFASINGCSRCLDVDFDCFCTRYLQFVYYRGYKRKWPVRSSG